MDGVGLRRSVTASVELYVRMILQRDATVAAPWRQSLAWSVRAVDADADLPSIEAVAFGL